ncbi:hypothetical protein RHO12_11545 [Orbus sturtevantii]|uniref:glycoside hydrolase family 19 protein n=1 Tax=Orbus sturtevantii TaxID=3074109 RepID=UPI00370DD353
MAKAQAAKIATTANTNASATATTTDQQVLSNLAANGKAWYLHPVGMTEFKTKKCFCERDFTVDDLMNLGIKKQKSIEFIDSLNHTLNNYSINTCLRKLHFLSQVRHESGEFIYTEELASGSQYEGRKDLGNIEKGDGIKFKGRGLIQITGRKNYTNYGNYQHINFTQGTNNLLLAKLPYCVDSAGWYWKSYLNIDLNIVADENDLIYITYRINGGFNGFQDRKTKLITMLDRLECNHSEHISTLFSIYNSRCFNLFDAVFKYAQLNTGESIGCYSQYLLLTHNYLNWNSIKGWENNNDKKKYKEKIERNRQTATNKAG